MLTFEAFQSGVLGSLGMAGIDHSVIFDADTDDDGNFTKYTAVIPASGDKIICRPKGLSMTVRFGSGHQAMAKIPEQWMATA